MAHLDNSGVQRHDETHEATSITLRYEDEVTEARFWSFLFPTFPVANSVTATATGIITLYFFTIFQTQIGESTPSGVKRPPEYTVFFGLVFVGVFVMFVLHTVVHALVALGRVSNSTCHRLSTQAIAVTVVFSTAGSNYNSYWAEFSDECAQGNLFDSEGKVYNAKNCYRYLQGYAALFVTLAVLLKLPFRLLLLASAANILIAVYISISFGSTVTFSHIQIAHTVAASLFGLFVRFHRERMERQHFEAHCDLRANIVDLGAKRSELRAACESLLPSHLMQRVEKTAVKYVDSNPSAAVLCVSIYDFAQLCTQDTPLAVAWLLDTVKVQLWRLADAAGLQGVSCIQDQVIAVGNLLKPMNLEVAVQNCCEVALKATSPAFFEEEDGSSQLGDAEAPAMHAAVHVGAAAGGFVGRRWVRYDVLGEGVATCRLAVLAAEANTVIATSEALFECRGAIETAEIGSIQVDEVEGGSESGTSDDSLPHRGGSLGLHVVKSIVARPPESSQTSVEKLVSVRQDDFSSDSKKMGLEAEAPLAVQSVSDDGSLVLQPQHQNNSRVGSLGTVNEGFQALRKAQLHLKTGTMLEADDDDGESSGGLYAFTTQWCCFDRFVDPSIEEKFLNQRVMHSATHASQTLLAFTWLVMFYFAVLIADFEGDRAALAAILLVIGVLVGTATAMFPVLASPEKLAAHHGKWSGLAMLLPLWVMLACAAARPSMVGNDQTTLIMVATFVRSTCFRNTKHQLVAKPLLLVLSQLHVLLPGARVRSSSTLVYFLVLWSIAIDRDVDRAERRRFVVEARLKSVLDALVEERRVRLGLMRSTMPEVIFDAVQRGAVSGKGSLISISDTAVLLVTGRQDQPSAIANEHRGSDEPSPTGSQVDGIAASLAKLYAASQWLATIERTLESFPRLTLVNALADVAIIVGPIAIPGDRSRRHKKSAEQHDQAVQAAVQLAQLRDTGGTLLDFDETLQITRISSVPSFNVFGPGMTRMLGVLAAIDSTMLRGAVVTDRVMRIGQETGVLDNYTAAPLGRMKMRGVGMLRLTKLSTV